MLEFEIQRCTKRCAKTNRELVPGETFFSVLLAKGAAIERVDYSEEAWEGPPEGAVGSWKSRIPDAQSSRVHWAPNDVMLDYFERLEGQDEQSDTRFVMALLLMRRRIVRLESTVAANDQEILVLHCPRNEKEYRVANVTPSAERARQIQDELAQLLFGDSG